MTKNSINLIQTEIGLYPADWNIIRVKDLFSEIKRGYVLPVSATKSRPSGEFIYPVFSSQTANNGVMGFYNKYLYEDAITWTTDGANAGDVNYRAGKFYCTNVCGVLISNKGFANQCTAEAINRVSRNHVSYIGNPKLMNNVMAEIQIAIPPTLKEQLRIAEALSSINAFIKSIDEAIAKKRQIKEGLMQQLLTGKSRLPGFSEDWKEVRLGDIFDFYKGSGLSKADLDTTGLNRCVLYGEIFTRFDIKVRGEISRTNSPVGTLSVKGDVLMPGSTTTTGIDLVKAVYINEDDVQLGGDIIILRKKQTIDSAFIAMLISNVSRNVVAEKTQGTTIIHLHGKSLIDIRYFVPESEKEQKAISSIVLKADADIEELSKKKDKLLLIKRGMMQELLTGKTRLI